MHYKQHNKYNPTQRERDGDEKKRQGGCGTQRKRTRERNKERVKERLKKGICSERTFESVPIYQLPGSAEYLRGVFQKQRD